MSQEPEEETKAQQSEAQRMLGRCMVRLQQYEGLLKALVADHHVAGPVREMGKRRAKSAKHTARLTLGSLIGAFVGSYLAPDGREQPSDSAEEPADGPPTVEIHFGAVLSAEDFAQTRSDLQDLVNLRNKLVHHFVDQYDLWTGEGCRHALAALMVAYDRIDAHYGRLLDIARSHDELRRMAAEYIQSAEFRDPIINGTGPYGKERGGGDQSTSGGSNR